MTKTMVGYQLPPGDAFEADLECALVFFPDREEYRRALLGSLTYFATWIAWERDEDKRGQDAARAWQLALECTLECWNMACIDELLEGIVELREALQTKKDCCDDNITYIPGDPPETEIDPGVGDPPDNYGETPVEDWDEWMEYLCFQAHAYVDHLIDVANQLNDAVYPAWIAIGLIAALLALLSFSGIGLPIAFGLAATVVGSLLALGSGALFGQAAEDLEDAREAIVCSLINGTSLASAVEAALASGVVWDAFYQFIDYDAATAIMYEGGWEDEFLDPQTRDDCSCEDPNAFHLVLDFATDIHPGALTPLGSVYWIVDAGGPTYPAAGSAHFGTNGGFEFTAAKLNTFLGKGFTTPHVQISRVSGEFYQGHISGGFDFLVGWPPDQESFSWLNGDLSWHYWDEDTIPENHATGGETAFYMRIVIAVFQRMSHMEIWGTIVDDG